MGGCPVPTHECCSFILLGADTGEKGGLGSPAGTERRLQPVPSEARQRRHALRPAGQESGLSAAAARTVAQLSARVVLAGRARAEAGARSRDALADWGRSALARGRLWATRSSRALSRAEAAQPLPFALQGQ